MKDVSSFRDLTEDKTMKLKGHVGSTINWTLPEISLTEGSTSQTASDYASFSATHEDSRLSHLQSFPEMGLGMGFDHSLFMDGNMWDI
jgi:hypothetical protein